MVNGYGVDWMKLIRLQTSGGLFMSTIMNFRILQQAGNFIMNWSPFSLSRRTLLHGDGWHDRVNVRDYVRQNVTEYLYEGVSKSIRIGRLERELRIVQLCATRCSCIAILWVSPVGFACHNSLCCFSTSVYCCLFRYRLSPGTFGYILVHYVQK
jgi:hypothetical protein